MEMNVQKVWDSLERSRDERNGLATIFIKLWRQQHKCLEEGLLCELSSSGDPVQAAGAGMGGCVQHVCEEQLLWLSVPRAGDALALPSPR